jgi:hypothetical protein
MGGDCIDYILDKSTPTANLTTAKLHFNSTISTPVTLFYGIDLANFFMNTPMECYKYICLWLDILSQEIINKYNLNNIVNAIGWVYVKIQKDMHGLPQAGILANKLLKKTLPSEATFNLSTHLVCGNTCDATSLFALSWTTLASR